MKSPIRGESQPQRIEARVGEELTVSRTLNASAGSSWELDAGWQRSGVVTLVKHEVEAGALNRPGDPGRESWRFRAVSPGEVTLRLTEGRSWEPSSATTEEVLVTVR